MSARSIGPKVGFVLGGGGYLGAYEVGMLRALLERGIVPDVIVGTSVGALNGAAIASQPDLDMVERLDDVWRNLVAEPVFSRSVISAALTLARTRTAVYRDASLRRQIRRVLPVERFESLHVPFQCVAACIQRAEEHWFWRGQLEPAILASSAVPGLLPPVHIGGEDFYDGGLVNSIPLERAIHLGASEVFVLHVGRIERSLARPRNLVDVALVSFEIARRHRFAHALADVPDGVTVHVLPTGERSASARDQTVGMRRVRSAAELDRRVERAHAAAARYLRQRR